LSTPEKILLVEDLWDSIVVDEYNVPVPPSHMKELDRRLISYKTHPGNLLSLEDLQSRIELAFRLGDRVAEFLGVVNP
jgi:putative addiction module component (TIGR02574 family)